MKLIDKDAVVAEIEKLVDKGKYHEEYDCAYRDGNNGALYALKNKLDTIEEKEVQEEPVSEDLEEAANKYIKGNYSPWLYKAMFDCYKTGAKWSREQIEKALLSEVLPCFMHGGEADEVVAKLDEVLNQKK